MKYLLISIFFISCHKKCPEVVGKTGTFLISAIAPDGIVFGTDTRASWMDDGKVVAWLDKYSKLHKYGNYVIAIAGVQSFDSLTITGLLKSYEGYSTLENVANFKNELIDFSKKYLSAEDLKALSENEIMICGFRNSSPFIYYFDSERVDSFFSVGSYVTNYPNNNNSIDLNNYFRINNVSASEDLVKLVLENIIKERNKHGESTVGGKAATGYIKPNTKPVFRNENRDYTTVKPMYSDILMGKEPIQYLDSEKEFILKCSFERFLLKHP